MAFSYTERKHWEYTLCKTNAFPGAAIDWEYLLICKHLQHFQDTLLFQEQMHVLFMCGMSVRVEALAFKVWRDYVTHMILTANFLYSVDNSDILREIQAKNDHFEDEHFKLKDVGLTLSSIMHLIDGAWQDRPRSVVKGVFDLTLSRHLLSEVIRTVVCHCTVFRLFPLSMTSSHGKRPLAMPVWMTISHTNIALSLAS